LCQETSLALFYRTHGRLTIRIFALSISLQDLGLHAAARIQEVSLRDLAQPKTATGGVWADFEQTVVEEVIMTSEEVTLGLRQG